MSKSSEQGGRREPRFEEAIAQIEEVIERIESGQSGLEESIADYERGMKLLARCRGVLNTLEQKVSKLSAEQDKLRVVGDAQEIEVFPEDDEASADASATESPSRAKQNPNKARPAKGRAAESSSAPASATHPEGDASPGVDGPNGPEEDLPF